MSPTTDASALIVAVVLGAATWTLLEYFIHRYLGHDRRFRRSPFGVEHLRHHVTGNYFAPAYKKVIAASIVTLAVGAIAVTVAGIASGLAYVAGLVACYTLYEWLHRREHTHAGFGPYGRYVRRHHFHHHFVDSRKNHGVTTPLWDFVFGTYERPTTIPVPHKLCMPWLLDPTTGEIRAEHAATYQLRRSR